MILSIVMLIGSQRARAERALQSVLDQIADGDTEVVLVDAAPGRRPPLAGQSHPNVRSAPASSSEHFGQLRLAAVRAARGEVVAFLEDHVTIEAGYLSCLREAFQGGWAAVGPVVQNANPGEGVSSAVHLMHYGLWDPKRGSGEADLLPGNNSAYRKEVLERYGDRLHRLLLTDTVFQLRLRADRYRLYLHSGARLNHLNATSLRTAVRSEFLYQRCFAAARASEFRWSRLRRLGISARTPLVPWVRFARLIGLLAPASFGRRRQLLAAAPALMTLYHAAALGQLAGLVGGWGSAPDRFTRFELDYARPVAASR